jgi:dipeptidyl aminopeptidase/acylaminoacyl peptidase
VAERVAMRPLAAAAALLVLAVSAPLRAQTTVGRAAITPGDNLVIEGIPPIPSAIAEGASRYAEFRFASLLDWHPERRELLISTRFGDAAQIHAVRMPGGARTQLTFFADRVAGARYGPAAGGYFVFAKDVGGGEWYQLYRYELATGAIALLTDGRSRNVGVRFARGGHRFAYASTRRTGQDTDIWVMDATSPATDRLVLQVQGGGWRPLDWRPDGRQLLVQQYLSVNRSDLWLVDVESGEKTRVTPETGGDAVHEGGRFARAGRGIYLVTDRESEWSRLAHIDLATSRLTALTADIPWNVDEFELSADGATIAFVTNEDGVSRLYLHDTVRGRRRAVAGLPAGVIGGLRFHANGRDLGFTVSFARSPADAYSLDTRTERLTRWTQSETGGLNAGAFAEARLVRWPTFDGRTLSGFLYGPDPKRFPGRRPVIVNVHGGPEAQSRPGFLGRTNYFIQELGVAVVFPNVRGSTGYGKTFLKLDNGDRREDTYRDIGALLDWIREQPDLDGDRVMVTGGSYGGYMAWAAAAFHSDRICCAVPVVGITSLVTMLERTEAYRRDLRRAEYGDERDPRMRAYLERIAPLNNADRIRKPILAVVGRNDPRVPWTESRQILDRLRESGGTPWLLLANDEGHGFTKKTNQDYQFYATVMFVRRFLLGEVLPAAQR